MGICPELDDSADYTDGPDGDCFLTGKRLQPQWLLQPITSCQHFDQE